MSTVTVPDNAYWAIFSSTGQSTNEVYIGDSTGTDADTGLYVEGGPPGPANLGLACSPGTVFKVRHDAATIFNYTFFYNKL